ncbi:DUF4823 domain-containing protein [Shewanella marinintestina]|uniref:DUF4823 domain-containing protein n=1 Tax=Shewanella marinintestina TaxID=190305 RepID=UPI00200F8302|nr:DUF4823 domain-containing protein [Shewanella marinintestina]MCL1145137.1 DUF4823 domain-containing protein [Shewanella marinintestina]
MNRNLVFIGATLLTLAGCSSSYKHNEFQKPEVQLDRNVGVLISTPENGFYDQTEYKNSGRMTANEIRRAFSKNSRKVSITKDCEGVSCLETIDSSTYGYYVQPIILHWEDRATEWSGIPDKLEIQIITFDSKTKKEIANTTFSGKSKWATFGGDHPQDLLEEPVTAYVESLYQ